MKKIFESLDLIVKEEYNGNYEKFISSQKTKAILVLFFSLLFFIAFYFLLSLGHFGIITLSSGIITLILGIFLLIVNNKYKKRRK